MQNLGKITEVEDLRSVWPHEASSFTPWLAEDDNIALLAETLGLDISVDETESSVGDFNVDIYAKEIGTDKKIIIENQLEDTNHDHLGKLITYASGKSADIIIWLVKHARDEHKAAIEWLNNHTDEDISFFLVEIKLFTIDDSKPAVKFEIIERPNDWSKEIKRSFSASETQQARYDFWEQFNAYAYDNGSNAFNKTFSRRKPNYDHWRYISVGSSDYKMCITQTRKYNDIAVELYINEDKEIFDNLVKHKDEIENVIGSELDWRRNNDKKASRILMILENVDFDDNNMNKYFDWIMENAVKMKKVLLKYV